MHPPRGVPAFDVADSKDNDPAMRDAAGARWEVSDYAGEGQGVDGQAGDILRGGEGIRLRTSPRAGLAIEGHGRVHGVYIRIHP